MQIRSPYFALIAALIALVAPTIISAAPEKTQTSGTASSSDQRDGYRISEKDGIFSAKTDSLKKGHPVTIAYGPGKTIDVVAKGTANAE